MKKLLPAVIILIVAALIAGADGFYGYVTKDIGGPLKAGTVYVWKDPYTMWKPTIDEEGYYELTDLQGEYWYWLYAAGYDEGWWTSVAYYESLGVGQDKQVDITVSKDASKQRIAHAVTTVKVNMFDVVVFQEVSFEHLLKNYVGKGNYEDEEIASSLWPFPFANVHLFAIG